MADNDKSLFTEIDEKIDEYQEKKKAEEEQSSNE